MVLGPVANATRASCEALPEFACIWLAFHGQYFSTAQRDTRVSKLAGRSTFFFSFSSHLQYAAAVKKLVLIVDANGDDDDDHVLTVLGVAHSPGI